MRSARWPSATTQAGRTLSQMLKDTYTSVMQDGQQLQGKYLPAIQEKARTLDAGKVLAMVRGT